jgi:hypothetical protein
MPPIKVSTANAFAPGYDGAIAIAFAIAFAHVDANANAYAPARAHTQTDTLTRRNDMIEIIGQKCIIRCYAAGVHYGTVAAHEGRQVTLTDSRRLWRWHTGGKHNGVSLSGVAVYGIDAARSIVEPVLPVIVLLDALEIIPASKEAQATIEKAQATIEGHDVRGL